MQVAQFYAKHIHFEESILNFEKQKSYFWFTQIDKMQKAPLFQRYGGIPKDSPQSVTPQNFKSSQIQTTKAESILLDTAKTSTKSQQGPLGSQNRQIMTLQNSQIHGRKVDSPKIYINESEIQESRPKTSAQNNRRIKNKRKVAQIAVTPANLDKKFKNFKKDQKGAAQQTQSTSGSCLTIFPAHPSSSRRPQQRFDFTFNQEKDAVDLNIATQLPITEREVAKRKLNSNNTDLQANYSCNNNTVLIPQKIATLSKYQQSRIAGQQNRTKSTGKAQRQRLLSQSMQLAVNVSKPLVNKQLQTPNQQSNNLSVFQQNQSIVTASKSLKSTNRQHKVAATINQQPQKQEETSRGRQTRSSDQKAKPSLAAASKKGMTIKKQKMQKFQIGNFTQNYSSKSTQGTGAQSGNLGFRLKQKSHSIESQSKFQATTGVENRGQFSFDLDNKENYPSNSSLHHHKSKPLSEQSKSVSAGRSRTQGGRRGKLQNDLSLSSLSQSSRNLKVGASGGSLSKMLGKQYFLDGEHMLKLLSPGGQPQRSSDNPLKRNELDHKLNSYSRASSPQKHLNSGHNGNQSKSQRNKQQSDEALKCTLDSKSGGDLHLIKNQQTYLNSLGELNSTTKATKKQIFQKKNNGSTEKQGKQKKAAQELLRRFMEETQRKTDREAQKAKDSEQNKIQELLANTKQKQKKKRSKSCISKIGDWVFSAREQNRERSKESANRTCLLSDALSGSLKKNMREQSYLVELNNLKREINEEIRRERNNVEIARTVVTPSAPKPEINGNSKTRYDPRKQSIGGNFGILNDTSLRMSEATKNIIQSQIYNDSIQKLNPDKRGGEINHKIRKYIERQKRQAQARKSMKQTIEYEKHIKVKETLLELQKFTRSKKRYSKGNQNSSLRQSNYTNNLKNVQTAPGMNSTQQIQMLDHVRNHLPVNNLRTSHHAKNLGRKKSVPTNGNLVHESSANGSEKSHQNQQNHHDFEDNKLERTYQHQDLSLLNEESAIINIFRKELSSSKSNSHRQQQRDSTPSHSDIEYPLKELKTKNGEKQGQSSHGNKGKHNASLRVNPAIQTQPDSKFVFHSNGKNEKNTSKPTFGLSEFESIEPSRYPTNEEVKTNKNGTKSTPKQSNSIYDKSDLVINRKKEDSLDQLILKQRAAIKIQQFARGFLVRKKIKINQLSKDTSKKSSPATQNDHSNTAQSIRKMNIPSLNLQKINSADSSHNNPYHQNQNASQKVKPKISLNSNQELSSSARSSSIFDHNTFQHQTKGPLLPQDNIASLPGLIQIREQAIKMREEQEQKNLLLQLNKNQVSPRTFERKQLELEKWVTVETKKINKDKANFESNQQRDEEYKQKLMNNIEQDTKQINQILGSARSSQKSKHPHKNYNHDDLLASSAREGINSFRVDSQRKSNRIEENRLIDLIYENKKQKTEKNQNESSSQSRYERNQINKEKQQRQHTAPDLGHQSASQRSQSQLNSNNYGSQSQQPSSYRSQDNEYGNIDGEIPDFGDVHVLNQQKQKLAIDSKDHTDELNEPSLNRNLSQKRLKSQEIDNLPSEKNQDQQISPRLLNKNDARTLLHDIPDDDEAELTRQVMEVSPAVSDRSKSNLKEELKESLRSDNFFLNKMDSNASNKKEEPNNNYNNIRIEIGEEAQPNTQISINPLIGTISPLSGASSDFGIQRGGMSLESSTSGENRERLQLVINEIHQQDKEQDQIFQTTLTPQQAEYAESLTNEIEQLLLAELGIEFELLVNRDAAQLINLQQQQQQDQMGVQQLQGIKTDLFAIEKYVDEIVEEIKQNANEFLKTLNTPLSKSSIQILNQLQNTEIGSCEHFDENFPQILPLDLYLTLEKRRKETREKENAENQIVSVAGSQTEMLRILIAECEHIHNKVLFDCINDSLLQFKPYGKEGEPLPWTRKNRRLKPTDDFSVTEIFEIVKHDLFRWAITQAGTLPRREFVYRGVFDEELFSEIREKKLVALLAREMIETEPKWLNYEFEQAQVKIDVGDMILEMLVTEAIQVLKQNEEKADLTNNPLLNGPQNEGNENMGQNGKRNLEPYEAHILNEIGIGGIDLNQRQRDSSQNERSSYNSNDSDFSNHDEVSQIVDDFGGNQIVR